MSPAISAVHTLQYNGGCGHHITVKITSVSIQFVLKLLYTQFDALIERLTGRELLTMFARLRGIPERYIKEIADNEIRRLDLAKHADKPCGTYRWDSTANKFINVCFSSALCTGRMTHCIDANIV